MIRLESLRKERGFSQKQIAEIFKISQQGYSNYENGKREPDFKTLNKFAKFFEVSTDYILGNTEDPTPVNKIKVSEQKKGSENMSKEDLNLPVTKAQLNKTISKLATKDDINKILELLENYLDTDFNNQKGV